MVSLPRMSWVEGVTRPKNEKEKKGLSWMCLEMNRSWLYLLTDGYDLDGINLLGPK